jgi:hypothetical protein
MDSKLRTSPVRGLSEARPQERKSAEAEAFAEARKLIAEDCRIDPDKYLEEVRVAASGE